MPTREEQFEIFKNSKGVAEFSSMMDKKSKKILILEDLKEKRKKCKDITFSINELKIKIDECQKKISDAKISIDDKSIIDEKDFQMVTELDQYKKQYRLNFGMLQTYRKDVDALSLVVEQYREALMEKFESWYTTLFKEVLENGVRTEESVDDREVFDKLQMDRVLKDDPDGVAFYKAKKNSEKIRR
jgi:hypothetical protein